MTSALAQGKRHNLSISPLQSVKSLKYLIPATTAQLRLLAMENGTVSLVHLLAEEVAARMKTKPHSNACDPGSDPGSK